MLAQAELRVDWMSRVLFESPAWAIVVLAILWTLTRLTARRMGNERLLTLSWAPLLLIGALLLTSTLVTTQRERLMQTQKQLLLAVEEQDFEAFHRIVPEDADTFFPPGATNSRLTRAQVEHRISQSKVRDITLLGSEASLVNDDQAVSVIRVRGEGEFGGFGGVQIFKWSIMWRLEDGQWRAYRFECLEVGFNPLGEPNTD